MRVQQLIESQRSQIEMLHPRSPVFLFFPTDSKGLVEILKGSKIREENTFVSPELRTAAKFGRIIIGFYAYGQHLDPPPGMKSIKTHEEAKAKFPDSALPLVSLALTTEMWPHALYNGPLDVNSNIKSYSIVDYDKDAKRRAEGKISTFTSAYEIVKVLVELRSEAKRRKGSDTDWKLRKQRKK